MELSEKFWPILEQKYTEILEKYGNAFAEEDRERYKQDEYHHLIYIGSCISIDMKTGEVFPIYGSEVNSVVSTRPTEKLTTPPEHKKDTGEVYIPIQAIATLLGYTAKTDLKNKKFYLSNPTANSNLSIMAINCQQYIKFNRFNPVVS